MGNGNSGDQILVQHSAMEELDTLLIAGFKNLQTNLDNMEGELKKTCTSWTGEADQAFEVVKRAWHEVFESMGLALTQHAQLVRDTNDGFIYADNKGAQAFGDII